jgi:hypothetical protein
MPSSSHALQAAVLARLRADTSLTALLGGSRVFDIVPQPPSYPYIALALLETRRQDVSLGPTDEHTLTWHVWSNAAGRLETHRIIEALTASLDPASLTLTDHRLVTLTTLSTLTRRDRDLVQGVVRMRALTESL